MKKTITLSRLLMVAVVSMALTGVYFAGYGTAWYAMGGSTDPVNSGDASRYVQRYRTTNPVTHSGIVKGIVVDRDQYNAMGSILNKNPGVTGFRLYYGIDDNDRAVGIVAGIRFDGSDDMSSLFTTGTYRMGLCPTICDETGGLSAD